MNKIISILSGPKNEKNSMWLKTLKGKNTGEKVKDKIS